MHTHAPLEAVMASCRDPARHLGFELVSDDTVHLTFHGKGRELEVGSMDTGYGCGTIILYTWEELPAPP